MLNKVILIGIVKDDPVFRQVNARSGYHTFEVGTERSWRTFDTKEKRREIDWVPVIAWNKPWLNQAARKGDTVAIHGRIQSREVTDRASGFKYPIYEVLAEFVENAKIWKAPLMDRFGRVQEEAGGESDYYGDPLNVPLRTPEE